MSAGALADGELMIEAIKEKATVGQPLRASCDDAARSCTTRKTAAGRVPGSHRLLAILVEIAHVLECLPQKIRRLRRMPLQVVRHRDYRDEAEELYARLPVLKWLMRGLARQAAAPL